MFLVPAFLLLVVTRWTILPLLSQVQYAKWNEDEIEPLAKRIQNAGTEVVNAKAGGGSATLQWRKLRHVLLVL